MFTLYVVDEDRKLTKRTYKILDNAIKAGSQIAANDNTLNIWVSNETQKVARIYNIYNDPGYHVAYLR